jgi:hypothetical protein
LEAVVVGAAIVAAVIQDQADQLAAWVVAVMPVKAVHRQDTMQEQTAVEVVAEPIIRMHIEAAMADQALW